MTKNELILKIMGVDYKEITEIPAFTLTVIRKLFTKHLPSTEDVYTKLDDYLIYVNEKKQYCVNIDGQQQTIDDIKYVENDPVFTPHTPVSVSGIEGIKDKTTVPLGRLLKYVIVNLYGFEGKVPYNDKNMSVRDYDKYILNGLNEYLVRYSRAVKYLTGLTVVLNQAVSPAVIVPVKGIKAFRDKRAKELDLSDDISAAQLLDDVTDYVKDKLKDDDVATNNFNKTLGRYIKVNALFGGETVFDKGQSKHITQSLGEGLPTDKETFATFQSISRSASYNRGKNTAIGGVIDALLKVVSSGLVTVEDNCGTKDLLNVYAGTQAEVDYLVNNTYTNDKNHKPIRVKDKGPNRKYKIRSPIYCHSEGNGFCRYCIGDAVTDNPDGIVQGMGVVSQLITKFNMKAMHGVKLESVTIDDVTELF